jgi:CheY-like chemotaxis protein
MPEGSGGEPQRLALIVDDEPLFCRAMSRLLGPAFDEVHTATNPDEAEQLLEEHPITHLVCDYRLGQGFPPGTVFVTRWRKLYTSIQRAVLVTGAYDLYSNIPPEVDSVRVKGIEPEQLLSSILGE